jgi:hypothetical protein
MNNFAPIAEFAFRSSASSDPLKVQLSKQIKSIILDKLRNNPQAKDIVEAIEQNSQLDLDLLAAYIQVAMHEDVKFANEIQVIARQIGDIQGKVSPIGQDIEKRGNQLVVLASGSALVGSLVLGLPGAIGGAAIGAILGVIGSVLEWWNGKTDPQNP